MATEPNTPATCRNCPAPAEHTVTVKHHRPNPDDICREGTFHFCSPHFFGLILDASFIIQANRGNPCPRCGGPAKVLADVLTAVNV